MKLKKIFTFLFLFVIATCGILAGCKDKYANLKVICDKQEQGVTLYVGEQDADTTDIVFTVEGAGEDVSTNLKFSFEKNADTKVVDIVNTVQDGANTTITVKAIDGGETTLIALTEEGNKSCSVKINCVIKALSMQLNNSYKGVVVAGGESLVLNTTQIIKFTPENTTENKIAYSLKNPISGVTLTESGLLTVSEEVTENYITVIAKNILRNDIQDVEFSVRVIEYISDDKVTIKSEGEVIDKIELVSNFEEENKISLNVDIVTDEIFDIDFNLVDKNDTNNYNVQFVSFLSKQGSNAVIIANDAGECYLKIDIIISDVIAKSMFIPIKAIQLAKEISVNGITEHFEENIYTTYSNNLGHEFKIEVGNAFSADRTYFVLLNAENVNNLTILNADKTPIKPRVKTGESYSENFDVLQNGTSIYVTGKDTDSVCSLTIVATSTFGYKTPTMLNISLTTLLGAESISVKYTNTDIALKTVFVEVGKTVTLDYEVMQKGASIIGLDLQTVDAEPNSQDFTYNVDNGVVSITGLKANKVSAKLTLPNLVESEIFVIYIFETITDVNASVESPLTSKNIAKVEYNGKKLTSFVMALGVSTQLQFDYVGTLYDLSCQMEDETNSNVAVVSKDGNVYSKNVGQATIKVTVSTFVTAGNEVRISEITFNIDLTVYIPVKSISLSSTFESLYYQETLNKYLYNSGKHIADLSLSLYPHNVLVEDENLQINWIPSDNSILQQSGNDKLNRTFVATMGDEQFDSTTEYIDVIVNYYGAILTTRCIVNITNPVRAQGIIVSVDGKTDNSIYFDSRNGLSVYDGNIEANGIKPASINTVVYPSTTNDKKVLYTGYDKSIIYVSEDGLVYPIGVGSTQITVYARDSVKQSNYTFDEFNFEPKIINVVVADGMTSQTALRINDEDTFLTIKTDIEQGNNFYYYFANDVYLTNSISNFGNFAGYIDGKNNNLFNLKFADVHNQYIFNQINGSISNLKITANINSEITENAIISVLANENNGTISGVMVSFSSFEIKNKAIDANLMLSSLTNQNNGQINKCYVNSNLKLTGEKFNELTIGLLASINNGKILGNHNNYFYGNNSIVDFNIEGFINAEVTANTSAVGGIVGINHNKIGSNNNGALLGEGFATNLVIYTPNLNNVGGIAGSNTGTVSNTLVYGNITANENVGGVVGINTTLNVVENNATVTHTGKIETSIVELYKNAFASDEYYSIVGNQNVGGIVGSLTGKFDIYGDISNSYIISYGSNSVVKSQGYAGGVAGYADNANIFMSSSNTKVEGNIVGGLVGYAKDVNVEDCYSRGIIVNAIASGKIFGELGADSRIATSYSTIADENIILPLDKTIIENEEEVVTTSSTSYFVGKISNGNLTVNNSYHLYTSLEDTDNTTLSNDKNNGITKSSDELTSISTYNSWSISSQKSYNSTWNINSENNDGYPVIKYVSYLQYKTTATKIFVEKAEGVRSDNEIIILNINQTYNLLETFIISTDLIGINTAILVTANVAGVINTNLVSSAATLYSSTEQLVTLTFMLQTNTSIQVNVQILFTQALSRFEFTKPQITLKVNESEKISAYIFDAKNNLISSDSYYFGTDWSYDEYLQFDENTSDKISVSNKIFFQNGSVISAKEANSNNIELVIKLYKKVGNTYVNIFGDENQTKSVVLNIVLSRGATGIDIDKKQVSMTVINTITLNVTIYTDDTNEKLYLVDSQQIINIINDSRLNTYNEFGQVVYDGNNTNEDGIFILKLINSSFDSDLKTKTFVFELSFKDEYKNGVKQFATEVESILQFIAKNGASVTYSVDFNLNAKPQKLLKIDFMHFPAGKQITKQTENGGTTVEYNPTEIPSNTLVPGQIGLLAIDLYPEYAFFDELQITTTKDASDNYINFIQVAFSDNAKYVELKPNAEIIPDGIVLSKQSNFNNGQLDFDGKVYVKTLVTTNVSVQTVFTVTVCAYIYNRDGNGNIIYGANGKPQTKEIALQKSIDIVVSPNPEVKISIEDSDKHTASVIVNIGTEQNPEYKNYEPNQYYLIAKGTSIKINTTTKNFYSKVEFEPINKLGITLKNGILRASEEAVAGSTFTVRAWVSKTINGMEERYYSADLKFYVVEYILTNVQFSNYTNSKVLNVGEMTPLSLNIDLIGDAQSQSVIDLKHKLETISNLWKIKENIFELKELDNKLYFNPKTKGDTTLALNFDYVYDDGVIKIIDLNEINKNVTISSKTENNNTFNITIIQVASLENPLPVRTIQDFYSMTEGKDYILLNDLVFHADDQYLVAEEYKDKHTTDAYNPFELKANSFDGNCYTITIKGFNTKGTETEHLGLFTNISPTTVVKNVFVDYQLVGDVAPLTNSQVIFGGLASQNSGVITNSIVEYIGTNSSATLTIGGDYNTVGAFVGINEGLITYSTARGQTAVSGEHIEQFKNYTIASKGDLAGFVCTNGNLIANCQTKYLGLNNITSANSNAMTAGFVCLNSGEISYSSVTGQLTEGVLGENVDPENNVRALSAEDERLATLLVNDEQNKDLKFAILQSNANIAGFVYRNNGKIKDTYSNIPMKTQARTSGYVFEVTSIGSIWTSYTVSYFDGKTVDDNTAHTAFIGTNELGEVLNDSQDIKYCYYISDTSYIELDNRFSQVATAIALSKAAGPNYVGFDMDSNDEHSVWLTDALKDYGLPALRSNYKNDLMLDKQESNFQRALLSDADVNENGAKIYTYYYPNVEVGNSGNPYLISSPQQFLNITAFNVDYDEPNKDGVKPEIPTIHIRLINNLDFSSIEQSEIQKLQKYNFIGDLDGNGLTISGLRVSGGSQSEVSFGLFKQIGTFKPVSSVNSQDNKVNTTTVRSLNVKVDEFAKSTSNFTGVLSGVVINTKLKNINIDAENITVLGNNIVGGIAGIITGESTIYNVTSNTSVESAFIGTDGGNYQGKIGDDLPKTYNLNSEQIEADLKANKKANETEYKNFSYAGGIAGIIDIKDSVLARSDVTVAYDNISNRTANVKLVKVSGEVTITAEKVGGLFGYVNEDVYMANSQFVVSTSNEQKLKGYYAVGGLIAENYGVIYLSKVEIQANAVDNYDKNLTNITGSNLFNDEKTAPVYIGGLVGVNYGGFISNSYSKTNVVHFNASYAGGIIGYATNNGKQGLYKTDEQGNLIKDSSGNSIELYRPTKLDQVYTTGNVFAGANYSRKVEATDEDGNIILDKNGNPKYYASSKNLAGGIFGKLHLIEKDLKNTSIQNQMQYITGVLGLNGFYKPNSYIVDQTLNDNGLSYGNIAKGFDGTVTLSSGKEQTTTYGATVGAFAGEVDFASESDLAGDLSFEISNYNYMFTTFAYNASTITSTACANAGGQVIDMLAKQKGITIASSSYNNYDYEKYSINIASNVVGNTLIESNDTSTTLTISPNNAYLLYRSENANFKVEFTDKQGNKSTRTMNYSNFVQDFDGIYHNWSILTWKCQSPVYPKFIEKDTTGYILIETEEDLRTKVNNNYTNYMLVADIFLTEEFKPITTFNGTFESAVRPDNSGINDSQYYGIYNININSDISNANSTAVGIFANADRATIKNINFIYGTQIQDPNINYDNIDDKDNNDWNWTGSEFKGINVVSGNSNATSIDVGSIIGFAKSSTITNCNVYYATDSSIAVNGTYTTLNVGAIVGRAEECQISGSFNYGSVRIDNIREVESKKVYRSTCVSTKPETETIKIGTEDTEVVTQNLNVGGLIGGIYSAGDTGISILCDYSNISVYGNIQDKSTEDQTYNANIGGLFGIVTYAKEDSEIATITLNDINNIDVNVFGSYANDLNIGGVAGVLDTAWVTPVAKTSDHLMEISNLSVTTTSDAQTLNIAGLVASADDLTIKSSYDSIYIKNITVNTVGSKVEVFNAGGFVGQTMHNSASISNVTIEECLMNAYATVSQNSKEENGFANIGGFVGKAASINTNNISLNKFTLNTKNKQNSNQKLNVTNNSSIGGFAGQAFIYDKYNNDNNYCVNCYVLDFTFDMGSQMYGKEVYVGGFAGRAEMLLTNAYAGGKIELSSDYLPSNAFYVGGFVGQFQEFNSDTDSKLKTCVADVQITAQEKSNKLSMAGFANINNQDGARDKVVINNSVALGDLIYTKGVFNGEVSGFVNNVTGNIGQDNDCYTLSTLKLISSNNTNIAIDYLTKPEGNRSATIKFNYNLSGSVYYKGDNNNGLTYTGISEKVRSIISNDQIISSKYIDKNTNNIKQGIKINPKTLTTETVDLQDSTEYYVTSTDIEIENSITNIKANIIGNDSANANQLTLNTDCVIGFENNTNYNLVSGIIFDYSKSKVISTNYAYMFNCLATSKYNLLTDISGFVGENSGFINACGTIVISKMTGDKILSGFVDVNKEGIISNSFANGVINNAKQNATSGFVSDNQGRIYNSYSSTTMFNRNTKDNSEFYVYAFEKNNISVIENCWFDETSVREDRENAEDDELYISVATPTNYYEISDKISTLNITKLIKEDHINFGLPLTLSFNTGLNTSSELKTDITSYSGVIKNIAQLQNVMSKLSDYKNQYKNLVSVELGLLTNLDGSLLVEINKDFDDYSSFEGDNSLESLCFINNNKTFGTINVQSLHFDGNVENNNIYTIYNVKQKDALFSAQEITVNNVGLVAEMKNSLSGTSGVLVAQAETLNATNTYVALTKAVNLGVSENKGIQNFGILVGSVTNAKINGSFTSGDIKITSVSSDANIGHMIGYQGIRNNSACEITNIFTSGLIQIDCDTVSNMYIGGIVGKTQTAGNISKGYSNVSLKNLVMAYDKNEKIKMGAIAGSGFIGDNINSGLYCNQSISLVDRYNGETDTKISSNGSEQLFNTVIFGQQLNNTKHFPVYQAFRTNLIYGILKIENGTETGSRMSPKLIQYNQKFESGEYYYNNSSNGVMVETLDSLNSVTIYGLGKSILSNNNNIYFAKTIEDSILSNVVLEDYTVASESSNSYYYNVKVSVKSKVAIDLKAGFIDTTKGNNNIIDSNILLSKGSLNANFGGIVNNNDGNLFIKNPTLNLYNLTIEKNEKLTVSGIINSSSNKVYIINPNINKLEFNVNIKGNLYLGGISASQNNTNLHKIYLFGSVDISEISINQTDTNTNNLNIGLLFGQLTLNENLTLLSNSDFTIASKPTISYSGTSSKQSSVYAGLIGEITGRGSNVNLSKLTNQHGIKFLSNYAQLACFGSVFGVMYGANTYTDITNSFIDVELSNNTGSYIGGVTGRIAGSVKIGTDLTVATYNSQTTVTTDGFKQNSDVNVTDFSTQNISCYVGGFAGMCETYGNVFGISTGLVAAKSTATGSTAETKVKDSRTYFESGVSGKEYNVQIPLIVGGIYGYYTDNNTENLNNVYKQTGSVRALLTGDNSNSGLIDTISEQYNADSKIFIGNDEEIQARAGAFAGLVRSSSYIDLKTSYVKLPISTGNNENTSFAFDVNAYFRSVNDGVSNRKKRYEELITYMHGKGFEFGELSTSNISSLNIFSTQSTNDTARDLSIDNTSGKILIGMEKLQTEWNTWKYYDYQAGSKSSESVFAGYVYKGITYNRSHWLGYHSINIASATGFSYANSIGGKFIITEHWAGSSVGGIIVQ